jgi:hypothetical protein
MFFSEGKAKNLLVESLAGEGYRILAVVSIVCDWVTTPLHISYPFLSQNSNFDQVLYVA